MQMLGFPAPALQAVNIYKNLFNLMQRCIPSNT